MTDQTSRSDTYFPFTPFSESVCRLNVSRLPSLQRELFNYAFYGFGAPNKYRRYAGDVMHVARGFGEFKDYNLPRGRYYAICNRREMENVHTCYEIKAYTNTQEVGPFQLADASQKHLCRHYVLEPVADSLFTLLNPIQITSFLDGIGTPSSVRGRDPQELYASGEALGRELGIQLRDSYHCIPNSTWKAKSR